jgi:alkylhydroperoxidase family enzyme
MSNGANELVAAVKRDWRKAALSEADRTMLAYAEKLTMNPSAMTKEDLHGLRRHFTEEQVYDVVLIASLFNFIDRIADAFGVDLDAFTKQMASASPEGEALPELAASKRSG